MRRNGSQASTEVLDCSVISNWTGRPVFYWTIVARFRTFAPEQMSSNRSLTRSQARSLLSIARLKMTRSRLDRAISKRTRMDQTCFGSRGFFWPISNPLFQGRWPLSIGLKGIGDPPPPRPPRRSIASGSLIPTIDRFWREAAIDLSSKLSSASGDDVWHQFKLLAARHSAAIAMISVRSRRSVSTAGLCAPSDDLQGRRFFDSFDRYDRASVCNANNAGQHLQRGD